VPTADLPGLTDAQRRLRGMFGVVVTFWDEPTADYPPGTPLDPDTGTPYDPTIKPVLASAATASALCTVAFRSTSEDQEEMDAIGLADRTHVQLIADIDDRPLIENAVEFDLRGDRYKVEARKPDGIGGDQRWLTWGRKK
jgi:hypothetical protein